MSCATAWAGGLVRPAPVPAIGLARLPDSLKLVESEREPTGRPSEPSVEQQGQPEAGAGHAPDTRDGADDPEVLDEQIATGANSALPPKLESWRRRSAAGAILTGFALGLQEALETRKDEPSIVMETSGDPPKDLPVEAEFEYGRPRQSVVQIRPWLLPDQAGESPVPGQTAADGRSDQEAGQQAPAGPGRQSAAGAGRQSARGADNRPAGDTDDRPAGDR